jgi:hypothetical protein
MRGLRLAARGLARSLLGAASGSWRAADRAHPCSPHGPWPRRGAPWARLAVRCRAAAMAEAPPPRGAAWRFLGATEPPLPMHPSGSVPPRRAATTSVVVGPAAPHSPLPRPWRVQPWPSWALALRCAPGSPPRADPPPSS